MPELPLRPRASDGAADVAAAHETPQPLPVDAQVSSTQPRIGGVRYRSRRAVADEGGRHPAD